MESVEQGAAAPSTVKVRRPWVAGILSLVCPGLGHIYAGELIIGIVMIPSLWLATFGVVALWVRIGYVAMPLVVLFYTAIAGHAVWTTIKRGKKIVPRAYSRWYGLLGIWVVYVISSYFVRLAIPYHSYKMPSGSMEKTIMPGDYLIGDNWAFDKDPVKRGDLVIFFGGRETKLVKRCVALPGDTIEFKDKVMYLNGAVAPVPEGTNFIDTAADGSQHIIPREQDGSNGRDNWGPLVVPADRYFMLGDNRDNSYDSRFLGPMPKELLIGRIVGIQHGWKYHRVVRTGE
jgi:signal peptidase I